MNARSGKILTWIGLLVVVSVPLGVYFARQLVSGGEEEVGAGVPVRRGPLRINVVERGNLTAANSVVVRSELERRTTIIYLIPQGTQVEEGTLVCELDASELEERRVQQEVTVENIRAAFVKAEQNYEIQVSQNESDVARAQRNLDFAGTDPQLARLVASLVRRELQIIEVTPEGMDLEDVFLSLTDGKVQ